MTLSSSDSSASRPPFRALVIGCIGVVYGDIGTSPLYAFREAALHLHERALLEKDILGLLSLILWSLLITVTLKYILLLLRADNKGEGGILALMALAQSVSRQGKKRAGAVFLAGVVGAALFFGEASVTPAISVLSAVEGLKLVAPSLHSYVLPISITILITLFSVQRHGTQKVARLFGPVTVVWFSCLAIGGLSWIVRSPEVLLSISPLYAVSFLSSHGTLSFVILGSVFLAVTGAEALYSDLGHFGRKPIQSAWVFFVFPSLMLCYLGQGALVLNNPQAMENPFFLLFPQWALFPMVLLATAATIIASQAVITGAYSLSRQAITLGLVPRMEIFHTSESQEGQIYIPKINILLLICVLLLCLVFKTSGALASAYGIAVTGTMLVSSVLAFVVLSSVWKKGPLFATLILLPFILVEGVFFSSNLLKLFDGGYIPLVLGAYLFLLIFVWVKGTAYLQKKALKNALPLFRLIDLLRKDPPLTVSGTAIFLTNDPSHVPETMVQNLRHNKVFHEKNIILNVNVLDIPRVPIDQRVHLDVLTPQISKLTLDFGFMETPNIPAALYLARAEGHDIDIENASFFLAHRKLISNPMSGLPVWQEKIFMALSKTADDATDFFRIPPSQAVELGTRISI